MTKAKKCSCGNSKRKGMTHMILACWTNHPPRPVTSKAPVRGEAD